MLYAIVFLVFLTAVMLVEGIYLLYQGSQTEQRRKIDKRIRALSAGGAHGEEVLSLLRNRQLTDMPLLNRWLEAVPRIHWLDRTLQQTGKDISVLKFLGIQALTLAVTYGGLLLLVAMPWWLTLLVSIAVAFVIPLAVIVRMKSKRHDKFTEQFPDALEYMARSLRAGNPFSASLKATGEEFPDPIGSEFAITFDEMNYGLGLEDALYNLGDRVGTEDLRYFITAVVVQKQTGGNLAEILTRLAALIKARIQTYREIRVQAAEMKMSANVLVGLPIFMALAMWVINRPYIMSLWKDPVGPYVIAVQIVLMAMGYYVMRKMINFRV